MSSVDDDSLRALTHDLAALRRRMLDEGRPDAVATQHARGWLTARERIAQLFDQNTFREIGVLARGHADALVGTRPSPDDLAGDGVVTGYGQIDGRTVCCAAFDYTVMAATLGSITDKRLERVLQFSLEQGYPMVLLLEGAGGRIHERMGSLIAGGHERFYWIGLMSGWVPIVAAVLGPTYAGHANLAGLADYVVMHERATMALAGHRLVEAAIGQKIDATTLGHPSIHAQSGCVDTVLDTELAVLANIRDYLSFLPSNASERPPEGTHDQSLSGDPSLLTVLPDSSSDPYDMHEVVVRIVDHGRLFELRQGQAPCVITGLARLDGYSVGIIANNPGVHGGMMDATASDKVTHFISLCDAFGVPLVFFVDVPGFMVGAQQEHAGIIRRSARPLVALAEATVPRFTVIVRKAYGLAYHVMGGAEFHPDLLVAWPGAEMSLMGPEMAAAIVAAKSSGMPRDEAVQYFRDLGRPLRAAEAVRIDDVIDPRETRARLALGLRATVGRNRYRWSRPPKRHSIDPS